MSKYKKILVMLLIGSMVFQSAVPVSLAEELIKEESRENIGTDSLQQEAEIEFAEEETSPQNETEFQFKETEIFEETEFSKEEEEPIIEDTDILNAETNFSAETAETVEESENVKLLSEDILVEKIEAVEKIKLASNQSVMIDEEHFPDTEFREYVKENFDTDEDAVLSAEEIEKVTEISASRWSIGSLKGIEYFTNLKKLICPRDITELDVSGNVNLEYLACSFTDITELDVSNNVNLTYLDCSKIEITKLNVSNDINLKKGIR